MNPMSAVDFSGTIALGAIGLLTANLLLGLLLSVGYNPVRQWPKRRIKLFTFHNWTGYVALAAVALHAGALLFSSDPRFALADVLWPTTSPVQPKTTTVGAAGLYLLAFAVFTSLKRVRAAIGRHWWKLFHWTTYAAAAAFFVHGIIADPLLKGRPPDLIDAEKVYVEVCALLVIVATVLRIRHRRSTTRAVRHQ
ncbi:MAG TPA: ferric reductase-like transmembrane domain-containing protein [Vicinamibacterales bacterium]|jgi:predicted ferric reductase|nr:ferric reductase-like transmembrane domain-containing protein [Vicinamibacterales bacterium]